MGVRFACHACGKPLHVKAELAGKRGICPKCDARFRIPSQDSEYSIRLRGEPNDRAAAGPATRSPDPTEASPSQASRAQASPAEASRAEADPVSSGPVNSDPANSDPAKPDAAEPNHAKPDAGGVEPTKPEPEGRRDRGVGLLESEPESVWYVRPSSGGQYGPATSELLKQWIEEQRVASTALLWREGWPQWRVASEALPEWADRLPGSPDGTGEGGVASDGSVTAAEPVPTSAHDSESAARSGNRGKARFQGRWDVGATRRGRLSRRTLAVGLLLAISIALVVILLLVAFGPSMFTSGDQS